MLAKWADAAAPWAVGVVAAACSLACGAQAPAETVEVRGATAGEQRADVAGKRLLTRADLTRHGDTNLVDALKRVPGITVSGQAGRGAELRLAGLGGGYTQILLNGEPAPKGFSLDSLAPELVERVEILRGGSAEWSAQGIAGTINVVLRRASRLTPRELKLEAGANDGRATVAATLSLGDKDGGLQWGLDLGAGRQPMRWPVSMDLQARNGQGDLTQAYLTDKQEHGTEQHVVLAPRLSWQLAEGETLSTENMLRWSTFPGGAEDVRTAQPGTLPPLLQQDQLRLTPRTGLWRSRIGWALKQADGVSWDASLSYVRVHHHQVADFEGRNAEGQPVRQAHVDGLALDQTINASVKRRQPLAEGHALAAGLSLESGRRQEDRIQREVALPGGWLPQDLDEVYDAGVQRLSAYAQEEWEISPAWTSAMGLRWEGLRTRSQSDQTDLGRQEQVLNEVRQRHAVWSPVLRLVWSLPDSKDQLKWGLSRTYRLPNARELTPRRFVANENSPVSPNTQGNPQLQPELAWGLDAGWEHPLSESAQWTVNLALKRISNVILDQLSREASTQVPGTDTWVLTRANFGQARVAALDLSFNGPLKLLWVDAPAVDLQASLSLNRSRLDSVPGGRLPGQPPWALNLGLDHRLVMAGLSAGLNLQAQGASLAAVPGGRVLGTGARHGLDLYGAWQQSPESKWRLALSRLWARDEQETTLVALTDRSVRLDQRTLLKPELRLTWERKL